MGTLPLFPEEQTDSFINDKFTIDDLLHRSWQLRDSKEFANFFNFIARFQHYSRFNTMLVYIQNNAVTFFGSVSYWKNKFGRKVKPGARPYIILAPKGPVMLVYDIFDTEGKESPNELLEKGLGREPFEVNGAFDERIFSTAVEEARRWGITVNIKPLSYFNAGYITTILTGNLEICLKEGLRPNQNFTVLIHELAHLFLGHTGHQTLRYQNTEKHLNLPLRKLTTTTEELEAEAVSFLLSKKIGLESRSAEYIAGYIKSEDDLLNFSYETVIKTADKIEKLFVRELTTSKNRSLNII